MKAFLKMIKKWDFIIIFILIFISFIPYIVFTIQQVGVKEGPPIAIVSVENKEIMRIPLTENESTEVLDVCTTESGKNILEIKDNEIRVRNSECPEQICTRTGFISKPGQTIICLPHRLIVEIEYDNDNVEDLIFSY